MCIAGKSPGWTCSSRESVFSSVMHGAQSKHTSSGVHCTEYSIPKRATPSIILLFTLPSRPPAHQRRARQYAAARRRLARHQAGRRRVGQRQRHHLHRLAQAHLLGCVQVKGVCSEGNANAFWPLRTTSGWPRR